MKIRYTLLLLPVIFLPLALIAQGPLTPPGAPAPAGKTLQQIEPRTDVATLTGDASAVFVISAPGSYYLSGNVVAVAGKAGIAIAVGDVSLDLNGFGITGVAGTTRGVEFRNGTAGATVRNGSIAGIGAGPGIGATAASFTNAKLSGLTIRACAGGVLLNGSNAVSVEDVRVTGSTSHGIDLGNQSVVAHCVVENTSASSGATLYGIRCNQASGCRVAQLANATGAAVGISAFHVSGSGAEFLSCASGTLFGISSPEVENCRVSNLSTTGTGSLAGIAAGNRADQCVVTSIGTTGGGGPIGINGNSISRCEVNGVGSATSTIAIGISATGFASHCTTLLIGDPAATTSVTGINAPFATGCRVNAVRGSGIMVGITGNNVTGCSVESMTQTTVAASASVTGISALRITDCQVYTIGMAGAGNGVGYSNYRMASGCTVTAITNTGAGLSEGFQPAFDGLTLNCTVTGVDDVGILGGQPGCVARGCTVVLSGITAGTGILFSGASAVVENNTVRSCNTGINVTGANGLIVHNRITTCTTKINASATSQIGPIVTATGIIASTNPWANFTD